MKGTAMPSRKFILGFTVAGVACVAGLGLGVSANAAGQALFAPSGLHGDEASVEMPDPRWQTNQAGESYGSLFDSNSPENEPDLIQAVATNGTEGYVRAADLERAQGDPTSFASPEEAIRWQETEGAKDRTVPVYAVDGVTVVGEFLIVGSASQRDASTAQR
jgi:hypothetical protein